jgi:CDP-glucose 4,6-dehydratase
VAKRLGKFGKIMIDNYFWKGKKVLITGHTGFKGSWLTLYLNSLGANVVGFSLPTNGESSLYELFDISSQIIDVKGDLRNLKLINRIIKIHEPEIVFHLAAQSLVRKSYIDPIETYTTNVIGTLNLLESVRKSGSVKIIINVTTDKCYENKEWNWGYRENDRLGGFDPYSNSKACSELLTQSYRDSFYNNLNIYVSTVRAGNVIGGGDWAENRLIPDFWRSVLKNEKLLVRNPNSIRPWQHVLEPLTGYLMLAEKMYLNGNQFEGSWNFGPNESDVKTVGYIVNRLSELCNKSNFWEVDNFQTFHEAKNLKLDISKSKHILNWSPKFTIDVALEMTISWYDAFLLKKNVKEFTLNQINQYNLL